MSTAKTGDTVRIHYTGKFTDGAQFDSSEGRDPLEFQLGEGQVIPGLEQRILGMAVGDTLTATIPAADAYGPYQEANVHEVARSELPDHLDLTLGSQLQATSNDGRTMVLTVSKVSDDTVTLDANHPLAGKDLVFDVELVEIVGG